ncbi:MAG TPA: CBS domain-containing protein [Gemmatimonadaceae bacterium]|nr:CBS domain-containing protein [Gemmatimonadaceae bacterium]
MNDIVASPALVTALDRVSVADAMHEGVVSCSPQSSLRTVARLMTTHRVHAVVVFPRHQADAGHVSSWKVVTDLDLVQAATERGLDSGTAAGVAGCVVRCVQPDEPLSSAVLTMLANRISHLIVVDRAHGRPLGILSTLDIARALAGYSWPEGEI